MWNVVRRHVSGLPPAYWVLWTAIFINRLANFVMPFLGLYLTTARGLSPTKFGLVMLAAGVGSLGAGPLGGVLADRYGRKTAMIFGLVAGALAMLHLGIAREHVHICIAAFLLSLLSETFRPAAMATITDLVGPEDRVRAHGLVFWVINLGFSVSMIAGGLLFELNYFSLFVVDAVTSLGAGAVLLFSLPETRPEPSVDADGNRASLWGPYRDRPFLLFVFLVFGVTVVFQQATSTLPLDMSNNGITGRTYGLLLAINGVLIVALQPITPKLVERFKPARVLAVATLFIGGGFALHGASTHAYVYGVAIALWTLGEMLESPVWPAFIGALSPRDLRGSYQGAFQMAWGASACVGPFIGTWILEHHGRTVLWAACGAIGVVVAPGYLWLERVLERRAARDGSLLPTASSG